MLNNSIFFPREKLLVRIFSFIILLSNIIFAQQLFWEHTGGPMGGVVGDMAINSEGDIYAGVYSWWISYSGLYKSTDNGNSWNKVVNQFDDFEVYAIYITKENHIWVGTNFQGRIYLSTDNGLSWENKRNGYDTGECWAFGQSKDGVFFAGDGQYVQLYRSTNYGDSWELSANLRPLVFATDSNNIVYAGTHDGLFATTNNGLTWIQNNFLANIAVSSILIDTNNNIYCGTGYYNNGDGVFYSTNGGLDWIHLGLAGKVVLSLSFDSKGDLYAGTLQDGLFKTTDMGQIWVQYQNGLYRKQAFRLKLNEQDDIFIGSENEGVFRSTDGGILFEQIGLPISNVKNIVFSGDSLIFSSTPSGVQKYNRNTRKWSNLGLQNVEAITITLGNYLYAGTFDEGLFKSSDLGKTWLLTNLTIDSLMSVYNVLSINNDTVFAATEFNLRRSFNGGESWTITPIKTGFFSRGLFLNINDIWVTGYGISSYVLYKSDNFGSSFDSVYSGFTNIFQNQLSGSFNGYIFLGEFITGGNIHRSSNDGASWSIVLNKFCTSINLSADGLLIAASDSVLISLNYGESWNSIQTPLKPTNKINDIKEDFCGTFYFGTSSYGLYEVDIITNVNKEIIKSLDYSLTQNYSNPFNSVTKIKYSIPQSSFVTLKVYDILGNEIETLVNEEQPSGFYEVEFDASSISSGVYFYQLQAGDFISTKKLVLLK